MAGILNSLLTLRLGMMSVQQHACPVTTATIITLEVAVHAAAAKVILTEFGYVLRHLAARAFPS